MDGLTNKRQIFYIMFFSLITFYKIWPGTLNGVLKYTMIAVAGALLCVHMLMNSYKVKEIVFIVILLTLGVLIFSCTNKDGILLTLMALAGMKGVRIRPLLIFIFRLRFVFFVLTILLAEIKIIPENQYTQIRFDRVVVRTDLGFGHPNMLHLHVLVLLALYIYLYFENINLKNVLLCLVINLAVYFISISRTGLIIGCMIPVLVILFKWANAFIAKWIAVCVFILSFLMGVIPAIYLRQINVFKRLDELLSYRYTFSLSFYETYGMKLFGNNLEQRLSEGNGIIDCSYVSLLVNCGVLFTLFYVIIIIYIIYNASKYKEHEILFLVSFFSLYGITESFLPNAFTNFALLFAGSYFYMRRKKVE